MILLLLLVVALFGCYMSSLFRMESTDVHHPSNSNRVREVAMHEGIPVDSVDQTLFDSLYVLPRTRGVGLDW